MIQSTTEEKTKLAEMLRAIPGVSDVRTDEPMALHTSFRIGGPADLFVQVCSVGALQQVIRKLREADEPWYILGRGTNLLVGDAGYRGCIITMTGSQSVPATDTAAGWTDGEESSHTDAVHGTDEREASGSPARAAKPDTEKLNRIIVTGSMLTAGAGATMAAASRAAMDHGLSGLEFAAGIPGSIGGGLVMNAGAYGGDMAQVIVSALLLLPDGTTRTFTADELQFGYRDSVLKHNGAIALGCMMKLLPGIPAEIRGRMQELVVRRHEKQPLEYPSAGSTFKRPVGNFAGKLIMEAGLKGYQVGDAMVSEKHAGFVVNTGHATAADVRQVIAHVQETVEKASGVKLEPEVIFLGEF